jgi:hypothetical protein
MRPDSQVVRCAPNEAHGHPDRERSCTLAWLRFLDCTYAAARGSDPALAGSPHVQAARAAWVFEGGGAVKTDMPEAAGCWPYERVVAQRELIWGRGVR